MAGPHDKSLRDKENSSIYYDDSDKVYRRRVSNKPEVRNNALNQELNTIGTTAKELVFPTGGTTFILFHQHDTAKLYFGDSSVSSSGYPFLEKNDSLSLEVKETIELYAIADTAGVEVFTLGEVKE